MTPQDKNPEDDLYNLLRKHGTVFNTRKDWFEVVAEIKAYGTRKREEGYRDAIKEAADIASETVHAQYLMANSRVAENILSLLPPPGKERG